MSPETVKQVKDLMSAIEKHYQEQISALETALAVNKRDNGYSGVNAHLEAKHKIQDDVRDAAIFKLKGRLKEAEAREAAEFQGQQVKQAEQAASMKAKAQVEWAKAGGTPAEFEQTYPAIRSQMLQAEAIRLMAQKPVASNIRL